MYHVTWDHKQTAEFTGTYEACKQWICDNVSANDWNSWASECLNIICESTGRAMSIVF